MTGKRTLVGIPSYKRPEQLRACLESIACQAGDFAVFVADNDPVGLEGRAVVAEIAATYPVPISCEVVSDPGISAARNAILEAGRSFDFIAMLDDDETAPPHWLAEMLRVQAETKADAVGGPVRHKLPEGTPDTISRSVAFRTDERETGPTPLLWAGNNLLISSRAASVRFDPRFGLSGGEDAEWLGRLHRRGFKFAWCAEAEVVETVPIERATKSWVRDRAYRIGNADMRITLQHRGRVAGTASLLKSLPAFVSTSWKGQRARGKLAAWLGRTAEEYARP